MRLTEKNRSRMIDRLVDHELEVNYGDQSFIDEILRNGTEIKGYQNLDDDELVHEYQQVYSHVCPCCDVEFGASLECGMEF